MEFISVWKRLKENLRIKNYSELAEIIGVSASNVSKKKQKNEFPANWAFLIGKKYNLSTEWILTGLGPKVLLDERAVENLENDKEENQIGFVECYNNGKFIKKVEIIKGGLYEIDPINPKKNKMKGERVIIIDTEFMGPAICLRVDSEWHFKRRNYVEIDYCDLKLLSNKPNLDDIRKNNNC